MTKPLQITSEDYAVNGLVMRPDEGPDGQPGPVGRVTADGEWEYWRTSDFVPEHQVVPILGDDVKLPPLSEDRERRFYTVDQLGSPRKIEWLVEGWIAAGELSVIYGPGDSYKSFLALHWALEASDERDVVYIAGEGAFGLRTRVPAWMREHHVEAEDLSGFRVDELPVLLDSAAERDSWLAEIEDELGHLPDWIIVDTLSMCFGGDESNPHDMNNFVRSVERMRRARPERTAITIIHHTPVKDHSRERGTGALRNATFSMIRLSAKTPNGYSVLVECDRMKDAPKHWPVRMRLTKHKWDGVSSLAVASMTDAQTEVAARNKDAK